MKKKRQKEYQKEQDKKYQEEQEKKQYLKELEKKNYLQKTEKFLKNLGKHLNTIKKHRNRDNDDPHYKGLRKIEKLFGEVD